MKEKETPTYVEPDDPRRCHGHANGNQCLFKAVEGSNYCSLHSGREKPSYDLQRTQYLLNHFQGKRNVAEEIGILRVVLQKTLDKAEDDITIYSAQINQLILNINKLVNDSIKIEKEAGQLLDRNQVAEIAQELLNAVAEEVTDEDTLHRIGKRFEQTLNS